MAVPDAGTSNLSLRGIMDELSNNNYGASNSFTNISLTDLSDGTVAAINESNDAADRPDEDTPHAMSEFYSYDHDALALGPPTSVSYTALTTSTFRITFTENAASARVYIYQNGANAINGTHGVDNGFIKNANNSYITVDGSGTTNVTIGDASGANDTYYTGGGTGTISLSANDYINFYLKSHDGSSTYSGESSGVQGWTLPGTPGNLAASSVTSTGMTISWDEPSGGVNASNGYRLYFGTDSTVTDNTPYDQGGTSKSFTGLSASTTYYFAVKAKGGGGDFGAITSTGNQATAAATSFSSTINDFTLSGTAGGSSYIYSNVGESFIINNPSGDLTVTMPDPRNVGTMQIAMVNGSAPSNSDYVNDGNGDLITISSPSDGDEIYVRWRFIPYAAMANGTWTATFTCNGVSDVVTIGGRSTA